MDSSAGDSTELARRNRAQIDAAPPKRVSPWTTKEKVIRALWETLGRALWRLFPGLRPRVLRGFGGTVGRRCRFGPRVSILIPWNLHLGDGVQVADGAIIYALGPITLGNDVVLDYRSHLCAGSHDISDPRFPQTRPAIAIGDGSFIGLDAYVGPGVTLGRNCRVHPRASVHRSYPADTELCGNPARPIDAESAGAPIGGEAT